MVVAEKLHLFSPAQDLLSETFTGNLRGLGPGVASILIYLLMAAVLFWKPQGLFPARG